MKILKPNKNEPKNVVKLKYGIQFQKAFSPIMAATGPKFLRHGSLKQSQHSLLKVGREYRAAVDEESQSPRLTSGPIEMLMQSMAVSMKNSSAIFAPPSSKDHTCEVKDWFLS